MSEVSESEVNECRVIESGASEGEMSESGTNEDEVNESGASEDEMSESGVNEDEVNESGASEDEMSESRANEDKVNESGASEGEMSESRANEVNESGANESEMNESETSEKEANQIKEGGQAAEMETADAGKESEESDSLAYIESLLDERIVRAIREMGFDKLTPIQELAIPYLLDGEDIIGQAQTGTGKTAAFAIPALQKINPDSRKLQTIILCPTRELAMQAADEIRRIAKYMQGIKVLPVYGGQDIGRQISGLKGVQIIVGTPGRVMDHMRRHTIKLDDVNTVVLDEADEMLDMGFREDMELILGEIPGEHQTALFSATMPQPILDITNQFQKNARMVKVAAKELTIPLVSQRYYKVKPQDKDAACIRLLEYYQPNLCLIFCNTKIKVDELAEVIRKAGFRVEGLHGDMSQLFRDTAMRRFRNGSTNILIATDVAARGIDVDNVEVVINYDLPQDIEYYVHRIGRTGRAGKTGRSFTFASAKELYRIRQIERFCHTTIEEKKLPGASKVLKAKANMYLNRAWELHEHEDMELMRSYLQRKMAEEECDALDLAAAMLKYQIGDKGQEIEADEVESRRGDRSDERGSRRRGRRGEDREGRRRGDREENREGRGRREREENRGGRRRRGRKEEREGFFSNGFEEEKGRRRERKEDRAGFLGSDFEEERSSRKSDAREESWNGRREESWNGRREEKSDRRRDAREDSWKDRREEKSDRRRDEREEGWNSRKEGRSDRKSDAREESWNSRKEGRVDRKSDAREESWNSRKEDRGARGRNDWAESWNGREEEGSSRKRDKRAESWNDRKEDRGARRRDDRKEDRTARRKGELWDGWNDRKEDKNVRKRSGRDEDRDSRKRSGRDEDRDSRKRGRRVEDRDERKRNGRDKKRSSKVRDVRMDGSEKGLAFSFPKRKKRNGE